MTKSIKKHVNTRCQNVQLNKSGTNFKKRLEGVLLEGRGMRVASEFSG